MDRIEAMSMLVTVTEKGSLSAAGRALRVPLATLSRKISDLEAHLGTRLLVRTTRALTLTDAGIAYVAAARRIIEQVQEAEREAAGEFRVPKGELVVTAPIMFGRLHVLPLVADFLAMFAEINIRLILTDRNVDLVNDHVDLAVRIGALPDSSLVATQIGVMRTVTCASPTLLDGHGIPAEPNDLLRFPCITVDTPLPSPGWRFLQFATDTTLEVAISARLAVTTPEAAAQAAIHGVGVARLLHYQMAGAAERGELRIILERYEPAPVPVHLIYASRHMPLKIRRFLDFATPRLRQVLAAIHCGSSG